jgi:hypothetical protein
MNKPVTASLLAPDLASMLMQEAAGLLKPLAYPFPGLDTQLVEDAISESIIEWMRAAPPGSVTEVRSFLYRAAWRNLRDITASERARKGRERAWTAEQAQYTSISVAGESRLEQVIALIQELLPDERLRTVFALRACGERRTSVYAAALELEEGDPAEAAAVVKREKDRLDKHLPRDARIRRIAAAALQRRADDADVERQPSNPIT